ncbi:MAG TPA: hypothetical protein VN739_06960 [Nitrososphaerales archaeon]|nr:hypothetical protein [Nitrososphaerales archaeon]
MYSFSSNVKEVHLAYGVYDIIAKIEGRNQEVKETITNSFSLTSKVQFHLREDLF